MPRPTPPPGSLARKLAALLAGATLALPFTVGAGTAHPATAGITFYVATNGADTNAGTSATTPVATLARAQQLVRAALPGNPGPITVSVAGGTYHLASPLALTTADSGTTTSPVTWTAAPGATATLSGGRTLQPVWQPVSSGSPVMAATVPAGLGFDGLFVNGQRQILARYPNVDPTASRLDGSTSLADLNSRSATWSNPATGDVRAMHCDDWGSFSYAITGRTNGALNLRYSGDNNRPQSCGSATAPTPGPVLAENIEEELDAPGEWFYDKTDGRLLFYPPSGTNLSTATVETAEQDELITVTGSSSTAPVHTITFSGFHFTQTHRTLFDTAYQPDAKGDWSVSRKGAVHLTNSENVTVTRSSFDQLGGNGVFLDGYNESDTVSASRFSYDGESDVQVVGSPDSVRDYSSGYDDQVAIDDTTAGPKSANYPRNILVQGNQMGNMGQFQTQSSGVNISMAQNVTVDGNTIHDSPRACLNIEDGTWGGDDIKNNDLFNCVTGTGDNGSINVWGRGRYWAGAGNNSLASGTAFEGSTGTALTDAQAKDMMKLDVTAPITIEHNRFWHGGDWAIDLDDGSSNFVIQDNLVLKGGIKLRDGFQRTVQNNILVAGSLYEQVSHQHDGDVIQHNITLGPVAYDNVLDNPVSAAYTVDKNLFWNGGSAVTDNPDGSGTENLSANGTTVNTASTWVRDGMDTHSAVADPQFASADPLGQYDFTVAAASPALALGFTNYPMTGFGAPGAPLPPHARWPYTTATGGGLATQPEILMGATATNVSSQAVESSLGIGDDHGLYLTAVPAGSYAAQVGLQAGDDVRAVNGATVTADRNTFWIPYNSLAAGDPITLAVRRGQNDVTLTFTKTTRPEQLNDTSGVVYTATGPAATGWIWRGVQTGGGQSYLDDIWATQNHGDSWSLTFNGTGLDLVSETNADEGNVALTLDGASYRTVSYATPSRVHQSTVLSITGLAPGVHTVTGTMTDGGYMIVDAFTTHPVLRINDTDPAITYSGFSYSAHRGLGDLGDDLHYATADGATATYTFTGSALQVFGEQYTDQGNLGITLDNGTPQTVNTVPIDGLRHTDVLVYTATGLTPGTHTVTVTKLSGQYATLDGFGTS
ncbi:PDZ domain-containing protein [Kitasatospora sp. NPDC058965]|uniref:PDZ domain-containing protein n=1 Tax=Kitasatospora sp. NPDC058965 TaxID=3346682 RepID=UPI00368326E1